jgi:hypothetical protein
MRCWRARNGALAGLERFTVAASAKAYRVINRPKAKQKAKTERIAFAPIDRPVFRQADYVLREPHRRNPYWLHYQSNWRDHLAHLIPSARPPI